MPEPVKDREPKDQGAENGEDDQVKGAHRIDAKRRRFEQGDPYFSVLSKEWSAGVRTAFGRLPAPEWGE